MSRTAVLAVRIITETKDAQKGLNDTASKLDKFESRMGKLTVPAAVAGAAVLGFAKKTGDMASIAQQNAGAVESVFKGNAAQVKAFADTAADKLGLSGSAYQEMASVIGSQLKNMGVPMDQVAGSTNGLIEKGADLAAMFGGSTADAVSALSSLLRGERDPIERYGISINDAAIQAQKAKMGLKGLTGEADKNATLTATMALLQKQSADATGQFAREADSAAGAQQRATAKIEDAGAKMGAVFLPAMAAGATALGDLATWASQNSQKLLIMGAVIGGAAAAVLAINGAVKAYRATAAAAAAVQVAWNAAMAANPIGLIIIGIAALVAGVVWAYKNVGWFKDFVDASMAAVGAAAAAVGKWFVNTWQGATRAVSAAVGAVGKWFTSVWQGAVNFVAGIVRGWQNGVAGVFRTVGAVAGAVGGTVRNTLAGAFNFVRSAAAGAVGGVRGIIDGIAGTAGRVAGTVRGALAGAFSYAGSIAQGAFNGITGAIQRVVSWIQTAISWVGDLAGKVTGGVAKLLGMGGATTTGDNPGSWQPAPAGGFEGGATGGFFGGSFGVSSSTRPAAPVIVNVTVNGALDPAAVGAQIESILLSRLRRIGAVTNGATPW